MRAGHPKHINRAFTLHAAILKKTRTAARESAGFDLQCRGQYRIRERCVNLKLISGQNNTVAPCLCNARRQALWSREASNYLPPEADQPLAEANRKDQRPSLFLERLYPAARGPVLSQVEGTLPRDLSVDGFFQAVVTSGFDLSVDIESGISLR